MSTSRASVVAPPPAGDTSPLLPKLNWSLPAGLVALPPGRKQVPFVHVVVAEGAHGVGQRLATHSFAGHYNCGVISCRTREGRHIFGTALGMHELEAGDSLVIRARPDFLHAHCGRPSTEFYVADPIGFTLEALLESRYLALPACFAALLGVPTDGSAPPENAFLRDRVETRAGALYVRLPDWWPNLTLLIFVAVVAAAMAGVDLVQVCAVAIVAMVVLSLVTVKQAIGHVDWNVYVTGAMAFGIGSAMSNSGVAAWIGQLLLSAGLSGPWLILVLAVLTSLIANVVTDRGSVQVMFPIALAIVRSQGTSMLPYTVAIANAALGGVLTPFGLSTSLIVAGPGRYVARDFAVFGAPLLILYTILSVAITCLVYGLW